MVGTHGIGMAGQQSILVGKGRCGQGGGWDEGPYRTSMESEDLWV